jgi:predicted metal-binding protein
VSEKTRARLIVCTTCRAGRTLAEGETPQGALLHAELARLIAEREGEAPVTLAEVACLANCERGCTGAIAMPGKWTYLLGHLTPGHAADLLAYGAAYVASGSGAVLPSRRPASLQNVLLGRVPSTEIAT